MNTYDALKIQSNPLSKWVEIDVQDRKEGGCHGTGCNRTVQQTKEINNLIRLTDWNKTPRTGGYNW